MPGPIGNAPLHNVAPQSTPTSGATPSGLAVRQEPAQAKRGFFSMFQKAQPAAAPAPKPITARTVFSSFANIKMLATKGYTATTNALKKEQCLQELGNLGNQRAGLVNNKADRQEIRKMDDAIAERSKSISAKEWLQAFGTSSAGLLMSMPKNSPIHQEFVTFNANYFTTDTILCLSALKDPANLTPEGVKQLFNKFIVKGSPYEANVQTNLVTAATQGLHAMQGKGDTSASNYAAILEPIIKEMENVVNRDPLSNFSKFLGGTFKLSGLGEAKTTAQAVSGFNALLAERPVKDLLNPELEKLRKQENIGLRDDAKVPMDMFEGSVKLKTATKDSLFGDDAVVDGLDGGAAPAPAPTATRVGDAASVASHPILSKMGEAMANRSIAALSDRPGVLLTDFAKTLTLATASQAVPQTLAELRSGNAQGNWTNFVDTLVSSNPGRAAETALISLRTELSIAKATAMRNSDTATGTSLDTMLAVVTQRLSGAPAPAGIAGGARTELPREAMTIAADPLQFEATKSQWIDGMGGKQNVTLQNVLDLPAQHPVRIAVRDGMQAHHQADGFQLLETLRNEPQMDLGRARQVVDEQLRDLNIGSVQYNALASTLGGKLGSVVQKDPNTGLSEHVPTITWRPEDGVVAAKPEGGWVRAFDAAAKDVSLVLGATNFTRVLGDPRFFP